MQRRTADKSLVKRAAQKLIKDSKVKNSPPLVLNDVVKYLRNSIDIDVSAKEMGKNFSGMLVIDNDAYGLLYNKSMPLNRIRFTVAHEIGHLILHHEFEESLIYEKYSMDYKKDWRELEANLFAAHLLMPQKWLKKEGSITSKEKIVELSSKYQVSEEALRNRIYFSDSLLGVSSGPYYSFNSETEDHL